MFDLEPALLRAFVAVVETGRMTAAGFRVGRTQPAISHQIKRLEEMVGWPLFGPDRRNLTLTSEGEVLLQFARAALRLNDEARQRFSAPRIKGRVTLGTPDLYAAHLLPDLLAGFVKAYPEVEVELRCQRSVFLQSSLERGELDLALITRQSDGKGEQIVRREPLVWVAGLSTRLEAEPVIPLALLPEGSVYRERALEALSRAQRRWQIVSISDSLAGLQAALFAGLAIAVFPRCALAPGMRRLGQRESLPTLPALDLVLLRRQPEMSEAVTHFADYIAHNLPNMSAFIPPSGTLKA